MDLGLRDRVCVLTGSTAGVGLEAARMLAAEGAQVVTCSRREESPEVGEAMHVSADLRDPAAPSALISRAVDELGRVDVLVNNVGDSYLAKFDLLSEEQWEDMWQLNVMSFVRAIQAVLPGMRERKDGVIVNVSST